MSEENNAPQPPRPPAPKPPTAKTSSVPLKKETVRITLRSQPGEEGAAAPAPTPAPPAPGGGAPPKPAAPAGSKTIPLSPAPAAGGAPAVGKRTVQLKSSGPATQPLPKATVQLSRTQPVSSAPPTAAVGGAKFQTAAFDDEDDEPAGMNGIAGAALALSFVLLIIMMMGGDKVAFFVAKQGQPAGGMHVPANDDVFDVGRASFESRLPDIPVRKNN